MLTEGMHFLRERKTGETISGFFGAGRVCWPQHGPRYLLKEFQAIKSSDPVLTITAQKV